MNNTLSCDILNVLDHITNRDSFSCSHIQCLSVNIQPPEVDLAY